MSTDETMRLRQLFYKYWYEYGIIDILPFVFCLSFCLKCHNIDTKFSEEDITLLHFNSAKKKLNLLNFFLQPNVFRFLYQGFISIYSFSKLKAIVIQSVSVLQY